MLSRKILIKFFNKLKPKHFKKDRFLDNFYNSYKNEKNITLFDFYIEYLLRNKKYDVKQKIEQTNILCDNIKNAILSYNKTFNDDETKINNIPNNSNETKSNKKIVLNKDHCLIVLSDFIKSSSLIEYEQDVDRPTEHDEKFKELTTEAIMEDIKQDGRELPVVRKDARFNKINSMLNVWRDTENKCREFINNNALANVLKKTYYIDGSIINIRSKTPIQTITNNQIQNYDQSEDFLPCETLISMWSGKGYQTNIQLLNTHPLTETLLRSQDKQNKCVYAIAGNQMIPGGNSDQGIFTNESYLYYCSNYSMCVDQVAPAYPIDSTHMIVMPNILVFKNHMSPSFPMLQPVDTQKISVISSSAPFRPATTLGDQDKYKMDHRLYKQTTKYKQPTKTIIQLRSLLNTALFFGYNTIILDDRGILDYWLPVHHNAELMKQVIYEFRGLFKNIIIAIDDKHIFNIYSKYFN